jgi:hypothetical protein
MSRSIDRLENLVRVLRTVESVWIDMSNWCTCAVGRASRDQYFIDEGLTIAGPGGRPMVGIAEFFGITTEQSHATFLSSGYVGPAVFGASGKPTPADVIAKLQVLLMEKRAAESALEADAYRLRSHPVRVEDDTSSTRRELEPVS